jgi:5-methylcytosine-specific restriction protein A
MSLNAALNLFLEVYQIAISQPSIGNAVAEFVRREVPIAVAQIIGESGRYIVRDSPGHGDWACVPWVVVYDRFITETTQNGLYVAYLVQEDYSGVYLSLNQDAPVIRRDHGSDAKDALTSRAWDYIARLGQIHEPSIIVGPIDLKVANSSSLGVLYEQGSICARYYKRGEIPNDEILGKDLRELLKLYLLLGTKKLVPVSASLEKDGEAGLNIKDVTGLREHKRIEGNRKLAERPKNHATGEAIFGVDTTGRVTFSDITERKRVETALITEREQSEEKIQSMAYHDSLTGLPNRNLFSDRLGIALAQAERSQKTVGVAMLDLDKFKDVNDTLGHDVGDLFLKAATVRLSAALRKGDTIARFGGDEFVLILPDLKTIENAIQVVQKIVDSFCKPFLIDTHQLIVTTSIGIAVYPNDGTDEAMLLKNADIAMYQAKQAGRARFQLYEKA